MVAASAGIGSTVGAALNAVAIAGPSLAALVVAAALGPASLHDLIARLSPARMPVRWALVGLGLPLLMIAIAIGCVVAFFGTPNIVVSVGLIGSSRSSSSAS